MRLLNQYIIFTLLLSLSLAGCASRPGNQVPEQVAQLIPQRELVDFELLNVSLEVFDPGELPQSEDKRRGLSPEIREAEARFAPIHLKHTLQRSGYWGAVRVVPDYDIGSEVMVKGRIELSDGESVVLSIEATDARNVVWFRRLYSETTRPEEHRGTQPEREDAFQDLFNTVANDLVHFRNSLSLGEISEIRQIAALKYAHSMAPHVFSDYLAVTQKGRIYLQRLPAVEDPMLERVEAVKARDDLLIDAINDYYDIYYHDLWDPYSNWRRFRQEEVTALRKLEREALTKKILGITAIVGAIALGAATDYETSVQTQPLQELLIAGGAYSVYSGFETDKNSEINRSAIEELGVSFSSEAEPLVVEVEGQTIRLSGSAEQQYTKWRNLLKEIYARETGLLAPVETLNEPAPTPETTP